MMIRVLRRAPPMTSKNPTVLTRIQSMTTSIHFSMGMYSFFGNSNIFVLRILFRAFLDHAFNDGVVADITDKLPLVV